ncbi:MAG: hypothetical protein RLN70_07345 [Rhodospirillaceae bacterium]
MRKAFPILDSNATSGLITMKNAQIYCTALLSSAALSVSTFMPLAAQEYERSLSVNLDEQVSEYQPACLSQVADEWAKPETAYENYTELKLSMALNRVEDGQQAVVFYGKAYNRFLELDRDATVTCRIGESLPYGVSFRIAR